MAGDKARWTTTDEGALLDYLLTLDAKAGDGKNFRPFIWTGASVMLAPLVTQGGTKTASSCKNKWGNVRCYSSGLFLPAESCDR
jgi:hypothetical protein